MKFSVMQLSAMGGVKGDIFWDLAPWITYAAGYDLGCTIYVANPTDQQQEYALMAELDQRHHGYQRRSSASLRLHQVYG